MARLGLLALGVAAVLLGCGDPVRDDAISALGGEVPGVGHGPFHRPGQPCTVCHDGGKAREFSLAGTVYRSPESLAPLVSAIVHVTDSTGAKRSLGTNAVGSFYITPSEWSPTFPIWTTVEYGGNCVDMKTEDFRDTSCASCHADPASNHSVGHVYFEGPHGDGGLTYRPRCQ